MDKASTPSPSSRTNKITDYKMAPRGAPNKTWSVLTSFNVCHIVLLTLPSLMCIGQSAISALWYLHDGQDIVTSTEARYATSTAPERHHLNPNILPHPHLMHIHMLAPPPSPALYPTPSPPATHNSQSLFKTLAHCQHISMPCPLQSSPNNYFHLPISQSPFFWLPQQSWTAIATVLTQVIHMLSSFPSHTILYGSYHA
jgi:hypothetical protein